MIWPNRMPEAEGETCANYKLGAGGLNKCQHQAYMRWANPRPGNLPTWMCLCCAKKIWEEALAYQTKMLSEIPEEYVCGD